MSLNDAIADLKADVIAGQSAEAAVDAVAAEYSLNPKLVLRKFREANPSDEGVRAGHVSATNYLADKITAEVERQCKRYGRSTSDLATVDFLGKRYTVIGWLANNKQLGVSHEDGKSYNLRHGRR